MRIRITMIVMKLIRFILVKMGRGGSLPGKIAMRMCPDILNYITYPKKVVMVTGTNGKTTTSNMVYEVLNKQYSKVIGNRKGDNLLEGITTLVLANTGMNLKVKADAMVIEVDELNVPKVISKVKVSDFIINNFFRDQLDRAGEMETIVAKIEKAIIDYKGRLILNGDDPNVARLGYERDHVYYFGVARNATSKANTDEASEGKFCFNCNSEIEYEYYQYSHIGRFHCPNCSFGDYKLYVEANEVDLDKSSFSTCNLTFRAPQDALFSIYNCMAVIALAKVNNIDLEIVKNVLAKFELKDGRMEIFNIGRECLLNLVKNPTGANETMKYIERDEEAKDIVVILNDNDQDGKDISWIWDANFDLIMKDDVKNIICSGLRAYDMALRLKYTDYQGNIIVKENMDDAIKCLKQLENHAYVIATYTALQPIRAILRRNEQ